MRNGCMVFARAALSMLNEENYETLRLDEEPAGVELGLAPGRIDSSSLGPLRLS